MPEDIKPINVGEKLTAVSAIGRFFGSGAGYEKVSMNEHKALSKEERDALANDIAKLTGCTIQAPQ
jgi:hypothetical protein